MRDSMRLYATLVIWIAFATMTGVLFTSVTSVLADASSGIVLAVLITLALASMISTFAVWGGFEEESGPAAHDSGVGKIKRASTGEHARRNHQSRVTRLLDTLDEDEIDELELLLHAREARAKHDRLSR